MPLAKPEDLQKTERTTSNRKQDQDITVRFSKSGNHEQERKIQTASSPRLNEMFMKINVELNQGIPALIPLLEIMVSGRQREAIT